MEGEGMSGVLIISSFLLSTTPLLPIMTPLSIPYDNDTINDNDE